MILEVYGFDILIDHEFHMWLLEVNTMPCMGTTEDNDFEVKGPMLAQALSTRKADENNGNYILVGTIIGITSLLSNPHPLRTRELVLVPLSTSEVTPKSWTD